MIEEMERDLKEVIESAISQIRPYLQSDGGDIEFVKISSDLKVYVKLKGACESCPMSHQTMKNGVEAAIRRAVPDIKSVIAV